LDLITVGRETGRQVKVKVRGLEVSSDMSEQDGGRDAGMAPAEMLAGSLGACVAMMVQGYCDARGYTDGDVAVCVSLEMADNPKRVGGFAIDVELPNGIPQEKMDAVRRVAELCPVHETLAHPPRVDIEFV
jgi:putative redox protein